jgi:UDP-N-acetylglucosamine:LPS N-acetylglucosamine transferase
MKICLVSSSGGHLTHLYMLKPFWEHENRFWVTFPTEDAATLLKDEKTYACHYPTNRSLKALMINTGLAFHILHQEHPDLIISTGAAVAVPFFYIGKLFGVKTVYIEVYDRTNDLTLTGKLVRPIADKFVVQWKSLQEHYPDTEYFGKIY